MEGTAGDGGLQVVDQRGDVEVLALEVALHERLVLGLLDDALDQLAAGVVGAGRGGVGRGAAEQPVEPADGTAVGAQRQVQRRDAGPERLLAGRDRGLQVGAGVVTAGHDDRARHADRGALLPLGDGRGVDLALPSLAGRHHEQRGVGGAQPGAELADEVAVAGGVDEVDLDVVVQQRRDGQRDRALLPDGGGVVVADGGAVDDGTLPGDHGRACEQRLHQRRLPCTGGSDEDHVAHPGGMADGGNPVRPAPRALPAVCSDRHGDHLRDLATCVPDLTPRDAMVTSP